MRAFEVETRSREALVDVTAQVEDEIRRSGAADGAAVVYVPHTTAGVTVNEGADPDVAADILYALGKAVPERPEYRHSEGNTTAHVKAALTGSSVTVPVSGGRLALGTWQRIFLCEFDGPRRRRMAVTVLRS